MSRGRKYLDRSPSPLGEGWGEVCICCQDNYPPYPAIRWLVQTHCRPSLHTIIILLTLSFILLTSSLHAQLLTPLSTEMNRRAEYEMIKSGSSPFTVLKPYVDTQLRGNAQQYGRPNRASVLQDRASLQDSASLQDRASLPRTWLTRKLLHESLIQVDSGSYYLFFDPVFDLALGQDNTGRKTFTNTRGFNAGGRLGKNFAFGTSFYENQAIFPMWVHNNIQNKVITGQGLGRLSNKTWDYAHASGYLSFSPVKKINIQLGQGKNFIGDGYRSLLLSDVAYNYPYSRISFLSEKWMYSWMLGMTQDISIPKGNDQYAYPKRIISSHLLSVNALRWLQLSVIKNTVYNNPDTTGKFSPGFAEFNPLMLPVDVPDSHAVWGLNVKASVTRTLWLYSQIAIDNLTGDRETKVAFQGGIKYFDAFGLRGLYLQGEFNQAEPETYSWDNKTLYWLHYREPLAHTYGNNFREGIFNMVYSWRRWQFNSHTGVTRQLNTSAGKPVSGKFPTMTDDTKVLHNNTQLIWFLNPKTTAHFSLGYVIHHETISGLKTKSSMIYFAFRTALFNNYLLSP